nr:unnamed protein product [Callosobruchus chinensis]
MVSHKEQMSQILRFVKVSEQKVTIEERFIDFIQSHEKTGEGLSKEILEKLEVDGLNIQDLRGQGYDNGSNMAAKNIMGQINYKFICTLQIWDKILESVDKVNVALQSKTMTFDKASELIKGLTSQIQNIRETVDIVFEKAKRICEQCDVEDNFPEKRRKRIKRHDLSESSDTGYDISQQQSFKIQINEAIDTIISELKWRFEKLRDIQNSFGFLTLKHITGYSVEELKKHAADLSIKYSADINATEFWSEIETLKSQVEATTLFDKCECQSSMGLLKAMVELDLKEMFPNVVVAIKIFLTMPVNVASCERSFRSSLELMPSIMGAFDAIIGGGTQKERNCEGSGDQIRTSTPKRSHQAGNFANLSPCVQKILSNVPEQEISKRFSSEEALSTNTLRRSMYRSTYRYV